MQLPNDPDSQAKMLRKVAPPTESELDMSVEIMGHLRRLALLQTAFDTPKSLGVGQEMKIFTPFGPVKVFWFLSNHERAKLALAQVMNSLSEASGAETQEEWEKELMSRVEKAEGLDN